jgi:hypothetical protein
MALHHCRCPYQTQAAISGYKRTQPHLTRHYVASHCLNCDEALRLACVVARLFPQLEVDVIDLDEPPTDGTDVFAVPTYVLNGRVCFLGNPSEQELCDLLADQLESCP